MEEEQFLPLRKEDFADLCAELFRRRDKALATFVEDNFSCYSPKEGRYSSPHFCGEFFKAHERLPPGFSAGRWVLALARSSPRLAEVRRFLHIAHEMRTGGPSRVQTVIYYH